jgi:hypothetical protein
MGGTMKKKPKYCCVCGAPAEPLIMGYNTKTGEPKYDSPLCEKKDESHGYYKTIFGNMKKLKWGI